MTREDAVKKALEYYEKASIVISEEEKGKVEVADFGLNELDKTGLEIITYVNTQKVCAKEMVLFPNQTCPEHYHPTIGDVSGKEETFRCRWGKVYLYVDGTPAQNPQVQPPEGGKYTVFHEIVLLPGQQYTLYPDTKHWFKAGDEGAVISEFSTRSTDENDIFTDERIIR